MKDKERERQATIERGQPAIVQAIGRWRHYTLDPAVMAASVVRLSNQQHEDQLADAVPGHPREQSRHHGRDNPGDIAHGSAYCFVELCK